MKGIIYKYEDKEGKEQKGVAFHEEQTEAYTKYNKVFLRLLNDDYDFKINNEGKKLISVKDINLLTQVGFWD